MMITVAKTGAPMPKLKEKIRDNPMKFYTYLVCLSGLATFPKNTRMFRQKDLSLKKIKQATGITDGTAKQYLYQLETSSMIQYQGACRCLSEEEFNSVQDKIQLRCKSVKSKEAKERIYSELMGAAIWKKRNKEDKNGVYHIPRPDPWTIVPEETLEFLNQKMNCSELEIKLYLWCVTYTDYCNIKAQNYKAVRFEDVREDLGIKKTGSTINNEIRKTLILLKGLGLLDFQEQECYNSKGVKIPNFLIKTIGFYIDYNIVNNTADDLDSFDNTVIRQHIQEVYENYYED